MDQKRDFCIKHAENVSQEVREHIFDIVRIHVVDHTKIAYNSDGVRIHMSEISDKCVEEIYEAIKKYLE